MKNKIKITKTRYPKYSLGVSNIVKATQPIFDLSGGLITANAEDTDSTKHTIGGAISGIGSGAAIGSSFGLPGIIGGAIVGGALGAFTGNSKAKEFQKAKLQREHSAYKQNTMLKYNNIDAINNAYLGEYNSLNMPNVPTFKNGGIVDNVKVYLDNNESLRTPDGNIYKVKGFNPRKTDDVLASVPEGTSVLSDDLKIPGTNKSFADYGHKLLKQNNKSYSKDSVGKTTESINKWAVNQKYNELLSLQEAIKTTKGNKYPFYSKGTVAVSGNDDLIELSKYYLNPTNSTILPSVATIKNQPISYKGKFGQLYRDYSYSLNPTIPNPVLNIPDSFKNWAKNNVNTPVSTQENDNYDTTNNSSSNRYFGKFTDTLDTTLNNLMSIAPIIYNWQRGKESPENVEAVQNPYTSNIVNAMSRRRYDVQPMLDMNRQAMITSNYNNSHINTNAGTSMAYRIASANALRNANLQAYNQSQQMNNQFLADYTNTLNNLGTQYMQSRLTADDLYRRNVEKQRDFMAKAMTQLNQLGQARQMTRDKKTADYRNFDVWRNMANYGLTKEQLDTITKTLGIK